MKPIGLRFKHDGELMVVHQCLSCGKMSNNRIAGDDLPEGITALITDQSNGIHMLTPQHLPEVLSALYGKRTY